MEFRWVFIVNLTIDFNFRISAKNFSHLGKAHESKIVIARLEVLLLRINQTKQKYF